MLLPGPPPAPLAKADFKAREERLRTALLDVQFELQERREAAVLLVILGPDGSGKAQVAHRLYGWLDPQLVESLAFGPPGEEERGRPRLARYWRALPARGRSGFVFGSWYHEPLARFTAAGGGPGALRRLRASLREIAGFEAQLAAEGVGCLKIWLDLDPAAARPPGKPRKAPPSPVLKEWNGLDREDPDCLERAGREALALTDRPHAAWRLVAAADPRGRDLAVGEALLETFVSRLERPRLAAVPLARPEQGRPELGRPEPGRLARLDLSAGLAEADYETRLAAAQRRLHRLTERGAFQRRGLVAVFEGNDAAGKGGAIRRVTAALDPRRFRVRRVGPPDEAERARPWLWRFWRDLPPPGCAALFDRSWYGRVLVERVEGLAEEADWRRAYAEIRDFERQLQDGGLVLAKFWLAIDKETQRERFEAREAVPFKRFKLTPEDWRNRARWDDYAEAAEAMLAETDRPRAPWTPVPAVDKRLARVIVLETLCGRLEKALG